MSGVARWILGLLLGLLAVAAPAWGDERILDYHSDIAIQADGSMEVTETITVRAEGRSIRRGIYRDFPTRYRDRAGNRVVVAFEPIEVLRNGEPEPWFTERRGNGVRLNTGDDSLLEVRRNHVFSLRYRTTRQLGFFEDHDELYWNVTGLGWEFPIDSASATVTLPEAVPASRLRLTAYTGPYGATGREYDAQAGDDGRVRFETLRTLRRQEGLTIVVGFPKGLVEEPGAGQRATWWLFDNRGALIALLALGLLLVFYAVRWHRHGRDPAPGPVFPRYHPPAGESPGSLRYLRRMSYDNRCFTADVVDMGVRGYLQIREAGKDWSLHRIDATRLEQLSDAQKALAVKLFQDGDSIVLKNTNASLVGSARTAHGQALAARHVPAHFVRNGWTVGLGVAFWMATALLALLVGRGDALPATLVVLALGLAAHFVFGWLMHAPTPAGRALLDEAEGLRSYLGVAERSELEALQGPGAEPALDAGRYEALLPYALALDVEDAWTRKFTAAVGVAAAATAASSIHWYAGTRPIGDLGSFSKSLGSTLNTQISSAATPPGSSSGGGGGGFSGGGGGGGGGGGR